ncbi:DUF4282 domain-containing protein [Microbacterium sp. M]|uniref:DUF4282 domain-containing protein n=1 Tax=Microbacterium sp. M TaxID=3377125 RepID=UPI0038648F29
MSDNTPSNPTGDQTPPPVPPAHQPAAAPRQPAAQPPAHGAQPPVHGGPAVAGSGGPGAGAPGAYSGPGGPGAAGPHGPAMHAPAQGSSSAGSFFRSLFDFSFQRFISRRLAGIFYAVGLVVIALAFLIYFFGGIASGIGLMQFNAGGGFMLLLVSIIGAPIGAFVAVIVLRFWIEAVVALIVVAENTKRTADNTEKR